jgi:4-amino-4-deoxy-L-arabinose transferase-like glycosyltransferase
LNHTARSLGRDIGASSQGRFARLAAWTCASDARALAALLLLALALFLPGFASLPPMDRDEPRFAQATRQMLETRDFIDIRFQEEARHKKPVGIYWMQAATVTAGETAGITDARRTMWLYRLPSLAGAIALVLLGFWTARAFVERPAALAAGALIAASVLVGVEARLAKTDALMAACTLAAMGVLARLWLGRHAPQSLPRGLAWLFWAAIGLGILVKGPIPPLVVGLTIGVLIWRERSAGWLAALRPASGLALVALIVAPWLIAIAWKTSGAFFAASVGEDMLAKVGAGKESHGAPPGTYLLASLGTFWPLAPFAILAAPFAWATRREDTTVFLLAWIVPTWVMFEAVPTKLPHYVLPVLPGLAILVGLALARGALRAQAPWERGVTILLPLLAIGLAMAAAGASLHYEGFPPFAGGPVLLAAAGLALLAARRLWQGLPGRAIGTAVAASVLVAWGAYALTLPTLRTFQLSPRLAETLRAAPCGDPLLATAGYREPSLVLLTRTDLEMTYGAGAAAFLAGPGCHVAFVESREAAAFTAEAARLGLSPRLLTRVSGVNLNGGRRLDIAVLASQR